MSWNSTHTALVSLAAIVIAGFHFDVDPVAMLPLIGPLGIYIGAREVARIRNTA